MAITALTMVVSPELLVMRLTNNWSIFKNINGKLAQITKAGIMTYSSGMARG